MSIKRNKNIKYGTVDLLDDEFDPKNIKIRVTTFIDQEVLIALKALAKENGKRYQTLLNAILRSHLLKNKVVRPNFEKRVREIVKEELKKRA